MVFYPFYILSKSSKKTQNDSCIQQSDILFSEKHSTIYLELLAEHFQYEQNKLNAR